MTYANSPHSTPVVHNDKQDRQYGRLAGFFFSSSITIITCVRKCSSFGIITGSLKNCKATLPETGRREKDTLWRMENYGGIFLIIMSTCQFFMLTFQLFMSTCQIIMPTWQKNISTTSSQTSYLYLELLSAIYIWQVD